MIHRNIACFGLSLLLLLPLPAMAGNTTGERENKALTTPVGPDRGGPKVSRDPTTGDRSISVTSPTNETYDRRHLLGPIIIEPQVDIDRHRNPGRHEE